jgi:hypothetical protein
VTDLPSVVRAEHRAGFCIHLTFEPLKDPAYFRSFSSTGALWCGPTGADIAPETLDDAARATRANPALQPTARAKVKRRG